MPLTRRELLAMGVTTLAGSAAARLGLVRVGASLPDGRTTIGALFEPDVELALVATPDEVSILSGAATRVWRFTGTVIKGPASTVEALASNLGPTLRFRKGQKVRIRFSNRLPDASIVHWHGLDVPTAADGHPRLAIASGADYVYDFDVTNRAGTYWYHPHPHMQTGPQVYKGLAGMLIVSDDDESALALPAGDAELTCVLQDRRFDATNQFVYSAAMMDGVTGVLGGHVLVNGQHRPTWSLAARAHRIRVLNGSNARIYKLEWSDGTPLVVLGTDGGLLEHPATRRYVTLAPAQRVELWLDLAGRAPGSSLELRSAAFASSDATVAMGPQGMGAGRGSAAVTDILPMGAPISLATIRVTSTAGAAQRLPARLSTFAPLPRPTSVAEPRRVPIAFQRMQWTLGGRTFSMEDVAAEESMRAGSTHTWELVNEGGPMGMQAAHPIHLHGRQFRILSRTGGAAANTLREGLVDGGWMDTVLVLPGETVRIQMTFSDHPGLYLYHCHILEHEDMGMMRNFRITPD
jgi:FtsP/CotA-like multicopper oxidase with cupredoxin domain